MEKNTTGISSQTPSSLYCKYIIHATISSVREGKIYINENIAFLELAKCVVL